MRILVTGANGFIGKNLCRRLRELPEYEVMEFGRGDTLETLEQLVFRTDAVVHLAGENRPRQEEDFARVNTDLTHALCQRIRATGRMISLIFASSTQVGLDNPYGRSKRAAEEVIGQLCRETGNPAMIYRLPGVFGKWCKPDYNSVVATFCHNIVRGLPVQIHDPERSIHLVYIDDVVDALLTVLKTGWRGECQGRIQPEYTITLGQLAEQIRAFHDCRSSLLAERVGTGVVRALYATYMSHLSPQEFVYDLPRHGDERGVFVEMLKTHDSGQFSFFTAHPGVTRGGHYHHSKSEKFLVIQGRARFCFRHVLTNEFHDLFVSGAKPQIVETVPGWTHDVTNVGDDPLIVMLWASELFDRNRPDTIACRV
ncbi:MAG: NAD-dependent epimerase/dehydratase family protein [Magnetococcales bacterium]|nr:NAD-dependent epimerase/dehydratase family protein [Magnetococcales bacterium]